jgi:hypothetical protein
MGLDRKNQPDQDNGKRRKELLQVGKKPSRIAEGCFRLVHGEGRGPDAQLLSYEGLHDSWSFGHHETGSILGLGASSFDSL